MPHDRPFLYRKVVARKTGGPGRRTWEVGVLNVSGSTDKSFGEGLTTDEAYGRARLVNEVIEKFIADNAIRMFDRPLLRSQHAQSHAWEDPEFVNLVRK